MWRLKTFTCESVEMETGSMAPSVDRNTKVTSSGASYVSTGVSKSAYWARAVCTINCDSALVGSLDGAALHNFSWDRVSDSELVRPSVFGNEHYRTFQ